MTGFLICYTACTSKFVIVSEATTFSSHEILEIFRSFEGKILKVKLHLKKSYIKRSNTNASLDFVNVVKISP